MNISMLSHFSPFTIISGRSLLCSSTMAILLTLVLSSRLWLIIQWIMLSIRLIIMIWFSFTEVTCLWNFYISANVWKSFTDFWPSTDNTNHFIFTRLFFAMLINIFGRVWGTVRRTFCYCSSSWTSLNKLYNWQQKENQN